jgi:tetratricopeptide (TPR) repeat protein
VLKPNANAAPWSRSPPAFLGPEHRSTLTNRNNLALVLYGLGRLEEAESGLRTVLTLQTRVLGPAHPDTLTCRNNLAEAFRSLGRLAEAEQEHRAVLESHTQVLGAEHPDTEVSRDSLARVRKLREG